MLSLRETVQEDRRAGNDRKFDKFVLGEARSDALSRMIGIVAHRLGEAQRLRLAWRKRRRNISGIG